MSVEISVIKKDDMPLNDWQRKLAEKCSAIKDDQALRLVVPRSETYKGVLSAWHRIGQLKGLKARTRTRKSEAGTTIYLWFEKGN